MCVWQTACVVDVGLFCKIWKAKEGLETVGNINRREWILIYGRIGCGYRGCGKRGLGRQICDLRRGRIWQRQTGGGQIGGGIVADRQEVVMG